MLQLTPKNGLIIKANIDKNIPKLVTSPSTLELILDNIMGNSVEAMHSRRNREISIKIKKDNGKLKLIFKDNGPGISKQKINALNQNERIKSSKGQKRGRGTSNIIFFTKKLGGKTTFFSQTEKVAQQKSIRQKNIHADRWHGTMVVIDLPLFL